MKGQILDFSVQQNEGIISTTEGALYKFIGSEWKGDIQPKRGMWVDFEVKDNRAVAVYRALGNSVGLNMGVSAPNGKNRIVAALFALFLGGIGIHKFYLGAIGWGVVYLIFFWTFIPAIVSLIEAILLFLMNDDEFNRKYGEANP